jgi:hypothetical protein
MQNVEEDGTPKALGTFWRLFAGGGDMGAWVQRLGLQWPGSRGPEVQSAVAFAGVCAIMDFSWRERPQLPVVLGHRYMFLC